MNDSSSTLADKHVAERLERYLGKVVFATRWMLAPIFVGLLASLVLLAIKFVQKLIESATNFLAISATEAMLDILQLIDVSLVANLVLIVMFAGWESVIGPMFIGQGPRFGQLGFSAVKLRLIGSIAAIAAIQILETFMHISQAAPNEALWQLAILLGIGITGVLLALMDKLAGHHD